MARSTALLCVVLLGAATLTVNAGGIGRALKQANQDPNTVTTITVSADKPNVDAIAITPVLPYPQTGYYCNISGDSRLPSFGNGVFPLVVRVPVGVAAKVIFANITGTLPGTGAGCLPSVVQQPGTSVQQPGTTSVTQPGTSSVTQPGTTSVTQPGTTSVTQPGTTSVTQPGTTSVQQPGTTSVQQPGTTSVQQPGTTSVTQPGTTSVTQPGTTSVTQPGTTSVQQPGTTSVQQPGTSSVVQPGTSSMVQPGTSSSSVVQPGTSSVTQPGTSSVVQPGTASPPTLCSTTPTTVVQQPTAVVQQPGTPGVQQPSTTTSIVQQQQQAGKRHLLQLKPAPVEYISNNGSMGQPQLTVLDSVEGVPNIMFTPTAVGQTASFTGALQVAVTTTNDGYGVPYIPYQVDAKLSPDCGVTVKFIAV